MLSLLWFLACLSPGSAIKRPVTTQIENQDVISDDLRYHVLRAMLHAHEKNWKDSNTHFGKAAKTRPQDPFIYMHWGHAALAMGHKDIAIKRYKEALGRFGVHRPDLRAQIQEAIDKASH